MPIHKCDDDEIIQPFRRKQAAVTKERSGRLRYKFAAMQTEKRSNCSDRRCDGAENKHHWKQPHEYGDESNGDGDGEKQRWQ
eukprot:5397858-Pleurochrysis_carterae.AAC.4